MGVDENYPLTIGEETATSGKEKVALITELLNIANDVCITDIKKVRLLINSCLLRRSYATSA